MTNTLWRYFKKGLLFILLQALITFILNIMGILVITSESLTLKAKGFVILLWIVAIIIIDGFLIEWINKKIR